LLDLTGLGWLLSGLAAVSTVALCGASVGLGLVLLRLHARRQERRLAASLGMRRTAAGWVGAQGAVHLRLTLHPEPASPHRTELRFSVAVPTADLSVQPHRARMTPGDRRFDARFRVSGAPISRAFLNGKVQAGLLAAGRVSIGGRRLQVSAWREEESAQSLRELMHDLAALARALRSLPTDPQQRLRALASDDSPSIRASALALAQAHEPSLGEALARAALTDDDPLVRCAAAVLLREPSALAASAREARLPLEPRAQAAELLLQTGPASCFPEVALSLLDHKPLQKVAHALLRASGPEGTRSLIDLADRLDPRTQLPQLTELLPSLIEAMMAMGSVRAVPALRRLEDRLPRGHQELRRAIWAAVAHLQGPRGTAEAVGDEAGAMP
jgi:hypothetical protein